MLLKATDEYVIYVIKLPSLIWMFHDSKMAFIGQVEFWKGYYSLWELTYCACRRNGSSIMWAMMSNGYSNK